MEIIYKLTIREVAFLKALKEKTHPKNAWSGRSTDDKFIEEWENEINAFEDNKLTEKKDGGGYDEYWCYGLNKKGLALQNEYL